MQKVIGNKYRVISYDDDSAYKKQAHLGDILKYTKEDSNPLMWGRFKNITANRGIEMNDTLWSWSWLEPVESGCPFKVGDKVKCNSSYSFDPCTGIIDRVDINDTQFQVKVDVDTSRADNIWNYNNQDLELINKNTDSQSPQQEITPTVKRKTMENTVIGNLCSALKNLALSEPRRSYRKLGITDDNDDLTDEGKELLWAHLLEINAETFDEKVVAPLMTEFKKQEKRK